MNKREARKVQQTVQRRIRQVTGNDQFCLELADHTKEDTAPGTWSLNPTRISDTVFEWTSTVPSDLVAGVTLEPINNQVLGVFDR